METISSCFNLISHPDRLLEFHLKRCDLISERILEMKYISDTFYSKNELEEIRKPLIYFHDFGKGTDFFQLKIVKATLEKSTEEFIKQNKDYHY